MPGCTDDRRRLASAVKMYRNFAKGKILEVVRILRIASVVDVIVGASDYKICWEFPGKQLLVISVQFSRTDSVCLTYDASDGIFSQSRLERFCVSQEERQVQLHLAY